MRKTLAIIFALLFLSQLAYAAEITVTGSAGSLSSPATFNTFGETITNPADGDICFNGAGGTNNENLCIDSESGFANILDIKSTTGVTTMRILSMSPAITADFSVNFGSGGNFGMGLTSTGNDTMQFGTIVNNAAASGVIAFVEQADRGGANRSAGSLVLNPTLRVYSSDEAQANDYVDIYHDQDNVQIASGQGNINLAPASSFTVTTTTADNGTCMRMTVNATQANVTAADTFIEFKSTSGVEGSIAGTGVAGVLAYNTFTGSHFTNIVDRTGLQVLSVLEMTGETAHLSGGMAPKGQLSAARVCKTRGSKAAYGVYGGTDKDGNDLVLSIGTGYAIVWNKGKDIEVGDFLMSSDVLGRAELQTKWFGLVKDSQVRNYSFAKATAPIHWEKGELERKIPVVYLGG